jgi:hypothetical protein
MLARDIVDLTLEHLYLVGVSMGIAASLAIPVGILLTRRMFLQRWVLGFANVMQTVPSLALFGFLIPLPFLGGIGKHTAIVALVLYALLPILRNTLTGILAVDPTVRESAVAMGMTGRQLLWEVELPLATRTIPAAPENTRSRSARRISPSKSSSARSSRSIWNIVLPVRLLVNSTWVAPCWHITRSCAVTLTFILSTRAPR